MPSRPPASSFRRLEDAAATLRFTFEGEPVAARPGESVASALLAAGVMRFRETPVSAAPRGPWCLMGVCFECLVEIDGVPGRQSCLVPVRDGLCVRRQRGARALA